MKMEQPTLEMFGNLLLNKEPYFLQKKKFKMKTLWVLKDNTKNTTNDIKIIDGEKTISPNLFQIKTKDIMVITTIGCIKNYCKVITKGNKCFFLEISMSNLIKSLGLPILMTSKSTALNMKHVKQTLNTSYCFIGKTPYKVGKAYKNGLKEYLENNS